MSSEKQVIPEKYDVEHVEHDGTPALYATDTTNSGTATPPGHTDAAYEKRLIRRIDLRLLIILGAIYSISLIDRTNLSTVRVAGAAKDLKLTIGERYSIISLVFFVPYIVSRPGNLLGASVVSDLFPAASPSFKQIFELPSNILLRKIGARNLISMVTVLWGIVMIGMSFVTSWTQLLALRVLLGFFESAYFPASVYLISCW